MSDIGGESSSTNESSVLAGMDNQAIDAAIQEAKQEIEETIKAQIPLIGKRVPLNILCKEFEQDQLFLEKIKNLCQTYSDIIRVRFGLLLSISH